jgi:hypothetical protein
LEKAANCGNGGNRPGKLAIPAGVAATRLCASSGDSGIAPHHSGRNGRAFRRCAAPFRPERPGYPALRCTIPAGTAGLSGIALHHSGRNGRAFRRCAAPFRPERPGFPALRCTIPAGTAGLYRRLVDIEGVQNSPPASFGHLRFFPGSFKGAQKLSS